MSYKKTNWVAYETPVSYKNMNKIEDELERLSLGDLDTANAVTVALWKPPVMPDTRRGNGFIPDGYDPDIHLDALFSPLVDDDYVTFKDLGEDTSGFYRLRRYDFTPKKYEKTIVLTGCTHGNEYTGFYFLYQFLELLKNKWKEHPQLAYLRKNVRIITIPIINMWGFANQKRQNSNGVDLNRNFPYLWDHYNPSSSQPGGTYFKGTKPFSEKESQIVRDLFEEINDSTLVGYLDFHTITTIDAEHILFTPRYLDQSISRYAKVIHALRKQGNRIVWGTSAVPSISNYIGEKYNVSCGNPEWRNGLYGEIRDSVEMTKIAEYFGNLVIQQALIETKSNVEVLSEPFARLLVYNNTRKAPITVKNSDYTNVGHTITSFNIRRHGLLKASGHVKITLSEDATISLNPVLYQTYSKDWSWGGTKDANTYSKTMTLPAGTHIIDLQSLMHAFPTNYNSETTSRTEEAKFRLRAKTSAGTITLEEMRILIEFTPTDRGIAFEIHDATDRENFPEGEDYIRVYPDPIKFSTDDEE